MIMIPLLSLSIGQNQLAPGESWTYNASYTVQESDLCSNIINSATVNALGPCSEALNSTSNIVEVKTVYDPGISLTKISDKEGEEVEAGDIVTYTYYVTNTGDVNLSQLTLEDDMIADLLRLSGDDNSDGLLNPGEVWMYEGAYLVDEDDLCHKILNIATVWSLDPCNIVRSDNATAEIDTVCPAGCICCPEGWNLDRIDLGDQRALGLHNSQAENNVNIETGQRI